MTANSWGRLLNLSTQYQGAAVWWLLPCYPHYLRYRLLWSPSSVLPEAGCVTQDRSEAKPTPEQEVKETAPITKSKKDDVFIGKSGNFAS